MKMDLLIKFFETFNILKRCSQGRKTCEQYNRRCENCPYLQYCEITDHKLLQLLALCQNKSYEEFKSESLKKIIMLLGNNPYHKHQVQAIFKGER